MVSTRRDCVGRIQQMKDEYNGITHVHFCLVVNLKPAHCLNFNLFHGRKVGVIGDFEKTGERFPKWLTASM